MNLSVKYERPTTAFVLASVGAGATSSLKRTKTVTSSTMVAPSAQARVWPGRRGSARPAAYTATLVARIGSTGSRQSALAAARESAEKTSPRVRGGRRGGTSARRSAAATNDQDSTLAAGRSAGHARPLEPARRACQTDAALLSQAGA